jgi:hypothetical protein
MFDCKLNLVQFNKVVQQINKEKYFRLIENHIIFLSAVAEHGAGRVKTMYSHQVRLIVFKYNGELRSGELRSRKFQIDGIRS